MPELYYMETGSTDPAFNLAFEEYVLLNRTEGDILILWQNDKTVVIGRNQNAAAEIDRAFVEANGIRVVRRTTGGGAVCHDLGNLNYSFITDAGKREEITIERFTRPVVRALRGLGLDASASGRNDILVEGRKVSGTAQRVAGKRILHHGTLLFDSDPSVIAGALNADPEKYRSKGKQSVRARIGNIRPLLKEDMEISGFRDYLKAALWEDKEGAPVTAVLTEEELSAVRRLKEERYDTWEWNFGKSPEFDLRNKKRFPGGGVEILTSVKDGVITDIHIYGDFLARLPVSDAEDALRGVRFRAEDVRAALSALPTDEYFGTVTADEVTEVLFP